MFLQSILRRLGRRKLPGICWYPAKGTAEAVKQGGTADHFVRFSTVFVLDRSYFLSGIFLCAGPCKFAANDYFRIPGGSREIFGLKEEGKC